MAKTGFFLRGARGKLAGSVLQKGSLGGTIMRENVKPKNTMTLAKAQQQAVFANVSKFYAQVSLVLKRAWEGHTNAQSHQEFLKRAINDANNNGWACPKNLSYVPMPYKLTHGTWTPIDYTFLGAYPGPYHFVIKRQLPANAQVPVTLGDLASLIIPEGVYPTDHPQVSIIAFQDSDIFDHTDPTTWQFLNFTNEGIGTYVSTLPLTKVYPNLVFYIYENQDFGERFLAIRGKDGALVAAAIVISGYYKGWRRSTQRLALRSDLLDAVVNNYWNFIETYMESFNEDKYSDVYLNGGNGQTSDDLPTTFYASNGVKYRLPFEIGYGWGNQPALMRCEKNKKTIQLIAVRIGNKYLQTYNTKIDVPDPDHPGYVYVQALEHPEVITALCNLGVSLSVFGE